MHELQLKLQIEDANNKIPFHVKFLLALDFYASGSYQRRVSMNALTCVSQTLVSKAIKEISKGITHFMTPKYILFPSEYEEQEKIKAAFLARHNFPNVIGLIDGTHIDLSGVNKQDEYAYVNRKGNHSINTQIVSILYVLHIYYYELIHAYIFRFAITTC